MAFPAPVARAFYKQADACVDLGSPFTARLSRLLADRLPPGSRFADRIADWDWNPVDAALALRAAGALHALARSGRCEPLSAAYPPDPPIDDDTLWAAISLAVAENDGFLSAWLDSPPQTNEVARSAAVLGGCLVIADVTRLPLEIFEFGSSAGLNLGFDAYAYDLGVARWGPPDAVVRIASRWEGDLPPFDAPLQVIARSGCDAAPLDPASSTDRERLLAYVWPDQAERLARTASALAEAARNGVRVERADAADWVEARLAVPPLPGRARVLLHTIVWQYLAMETKARIKSAIGAAGEGATPESPLAWLSMEPDGTPGSASIRVTLWPGGGTARLGRSDYHGRWTRWNVVLSRP